ncbi:hypothetical protein [Conexibacter sp. DBS9H8]|nr:hypothetical protein [Conexibacter sp. DBS9H8]
MPEFADGDHAHGTVLVAYGGINLRVGDAAPAVHEQGRVEQDGR